MSRNPPSRTLGLVCQAARRVFDELGPGLPRAQYMDALEAKFGLKFEGCERKARLPVKNRRWSVDALRADFALLRRKVIVDVVVSPKKIPQERTLRLWRHLNATGVPLGVVLNFGTPVLDFERAVHRTYHQQWNDEEELAQMEADVYTAPAKRYVSRGADGARAGTDSVYHDEQATVAFRSI